MSTESHIWHPYTRFSTMRAGPLPSLTRGEGIHLFDKQGNRYTDAISSWWACALGHGHPDIVAAIRKQAAELQHSILGNLTHPRAEELAGRLARLMPSPDRKVMFAGDGASAVEAALKIAVQYFFNIGRPERGKIAHLEEAYHGDTLGAVSVGYLEQFHKPFAPILIPSLSLPVPTRPELETECREKTERLLEAHGKELAALIVEPLCQGSAGMRMYSAAYLRQLADLCRARGILLIADEIATGFGRTGTLFAFEQAGIDPDIVCVGKALSAGYLPISAAIVKEEIYRTFDDEPTDHSFYHGHTFCGNPIAAAAALAALDQYTRNGFLPHVRQIEATLQRELEPLRSHSQVRDVRCLGGIGAVELDTAQQARAARDRLWAQRILTRPLGTVLYLMPPLNAALEEVTTLTRSLREAVERPPSSPPHTHTRTHTRTRIPIEYE